MNYLRWAYMELEDLRGICTDPGSLRRWVNAVFPDNPLLHQHDPAQGKPLFQYPLIQYKIIDGLPMIFGIEDGVEEVRCIYSQTRERAIKLGPAVIQAITLREGNSLLRETEPKSYSFLTPWLALNKENLKRYWGEKSWPERKELLRKILVGNILSMAKSLGIMIDFRVRIRTMLDILKVEIPGHDLIAHGFLGCFEANLQLPPLVGLGRHVSLGFGTVSEEESCWT
jgi:hypothetical protein